MAGHLSHSLIHFDKFNAVADSLKSCGSLHALRFFTCVACIFFRHQPDLRQPYRYLVLTFQNAASQAPPQLHPLDLRLRHPPIASRFQW